MEVLGNAVLVRPDPIPEQSKGGIIIPRTAKDPPNKGTVIKAGPGCKLVRANDRIHYARKAASIIEVHGEELHLIYEDKIFYVE